MWNHARGWGYTKLPNPCLGIKGHKLDKRTVYITDEVFNLVHECASVPLRDALDLAYLTGQRPADALSLSEHDIINGHLIVTQDKTVKPLRIQIVDKLAEVIDRIHARKATYKIVTGALLVNTQGKRLTKAVLRNHFVDARLAARAKNPEIEAEIAKMWFYDLREGCGRHRRRPRRAGRQRLAGPRQRAHDATALPAARQDRGAGKVRIAELPPELRNYRAGG